MTPIDPTRAPSDDGGTSGRRRASGGDFPLPGGGLPLPGPGSRPGASRRERTIGVYDPGHAGPSLVVVAALHGNEPAGILAARRVLDRLERERPRSFRGRLVAHRGHLAALELEERYLGEDLNRVWRPERLAALAVSDPAADSPEEREMRELAAALERDLANDPERALVLDFHSASSDGPPFTIMSDTLRNRRIAGAFPIPILLGLEETVEGTLLDWLGSRGIAVLCVEGGRHADAKTVDHLESVLWIALVQAGHLDSADVPDLSEHRRRLRRAASDLPAVIEIFHRQATVDGDCFAMREGFRNFTPVERGTPLAEDRGGVILAPASGILVLPRYQPLGADGFFMGRTVGRSWLAISEALRRLGVGRILPHLPGVRAVAGRRGTLAVDASVARWMREPLFNLLGYRARGSEHGLLIFVRRPESPREPGAG